MLKKTNENTNKRAFFVYVLKTIKHSDKMTHKPFGIDIM